MMVRRGDPEEGEVTIGPGGGGHWKTWGVPSGEW